MSADAVMGPVTQETEELSPSNSILFNSDSSCSSLGVEHNSVATDHFNGSVESMELFHEERFSASDTEADSAISLVKCLNSESPSSSLVSRRNDNSAIIRLNNELLKSKKSNWEVLDALGKAYQDIKDLRLREQRLNTILSNCSSKLCGTNGFTESLALPDSKIIELQLSLRREEAVKTREDLRVLIDERDRLKEKLGKSECDRRLVSFTSDQRERELELSQSHIRDLAANIKEKDSRIVSTQDKLISFEKEMKDKDEELGRIRGEKNTLREAVIRSEQEIESLSEKLQNLLLFKEENAKHLSKNTGRSLGIQTVDSEGKVLNLNGEQIVEEETRLVRELSVLDSRHSEDMKVIHDLSSRLKEWESIVKSINEYVQDTNQQQLEARNEIADYVKMLEQQLREVKMNRSVSVNEQDDSIQGNRQYSTKATQHYEPKNAEDLKDDYKHASQVTELNQSMNFDDYLKCSSELDEESDLEDDVGENGPFPAELEKVVEPEDINLDCCFQSSAELVVQPDNVRMARLASIEEFVAQLPEPRKTNLRDSKTPVQRPARKTSSGKRRKLPQVTRKTSFESARSTDCAESQSDDTLSITSFESEVSRDATDMRRVSRRGSSRRLPPVPSGEEIDLHVIKADVATDEPAVTKPPEVTSIYHKGPTDAYNHRHDSGRGESIKNSPAALPGNGHKFSISRLRRKFSKEKTGSGSKELDVDGPRDSKKGLFQQKLCLGKTRRRRNSVGTMSSVSDSFRTVTPLNSDLDDVFGLPNESFDAGGSLPSSIHTSTPKKGNRIMNKGGVPRQSKHITAQRGRASLLLIFQHLNPVELCGLARVCREWRAMSEHPALWKHVTLEDIPLNNMALQVISRRCSCMQFLKLKGLKKIKSREKSHTSTDTEDMRCYLERGLEFLLKAAGSSLLSLHIEDCGIFITDRCLALAGSHCRELQEMVYISDSFPACPEALWALCACRKLVTLRVPPMFPCDHPGRFNDKSLETIANCWPSLRRLSVGGPSLSSAGLIHVAKGCLRIQELELDRAIAINEEIAHAMCLCGLRGLETISFTFTPVSPGAIKELLGACPRLERIEVHIGISDYFMNVDDDVSKRKYARIVKKLAALKQENPEFARVLWIKADYG